MTDPTRYQPQSLYAEYGPVRVHRGLDPLTGLPVLIYSFPGAPTLEPGEFDSEHVPGILASYHEGGTGQLVVAHSSGYQQAKPPFSRREAMTLVASTARALRDAAEVGAVHGDLRAERFLMADNHVLVEGYGVPWSPEQVSIPRLNSSTDPLAHDIFAWAYAMLELAEPSLPSDVRRALQQCLASEPSERPSAEEVHDKIRLLQERKSPQVPHSSEQFEFDVDLGFKETFGPSAPAATAPPQARAAARRAEAGGDQQASDGDDEPIVIHTDPGHASAATGRGAAARTGSSGKETDGPGFVKDLPPGGTYRSGEEPSFTRRTPVRVEKSSPFAPPSPRTRRLFLLVLLLVAAAILGVLALMQQNETPAAATPGRSATQYIVSVAVEPPTLRNVTLIVVSSPPGSNYQPGHEVTFVPGPAVLDQAGEWQLMGRFRNSLSDTVTVNVPDERSLTLLIPDADP